MHAEAFGEGQEQHLLRPMLEGTRKTCEVFAPVEDIFKKVKLTADAGFHTKKNMEMVFSKGIEVHIADFKNHVLGENPSLRTGFSYRLVGFLNGGMKNMEAEILGLIQERMITSYNEQIWAVTLVTSMNAFVIMQVDRLLSSIGYKKIRLSIWTVTFLCMIFILLRHGVYWHYSSLIDQEYSILTEISPTKTFLRYVVLFSGVILYTSITIGMAIAAILTCKKANLKKKSA